MERQLLSAGRGHPPRPFSHAPACPSRATIATPICGASPAGGVPRRRGAWTRLQDHFHTHPKGRLHEFFFWAGLGVAMGTFALFGWRADWLSTPIAMMLGVIALCLVGWAFLPQTPRPVAPPPSRSLRTKRR